MRRANGSRLGRPRVPPSPSLCIAGFPHPNYSRNCCTPWSVFQDGSNAADGWPSCRSARRGTTSRPDGRARPDTACSDEVGSPNGRERPGPPRRTCAARVEVPPLSSAGSERSAPPAVSSPPPETAALPARRVLFARSPPRLAGPCRRECRGARRLRPTRTLRGCPRRQGRRAAP